MVRVQIGWTNKHLCYFNNNQVCIIYLDKYIVPVYLMTRVQTGMCLLSCEYLCTIDKSRNS